MHTIMTLWLHDIFHNELVATNLGCHNKTATATANQQQTPDTIAHCTAFASITFGDQRKHNCNVGLWPMYHITLVGLPGVNMHMERKRFMVIGCGGRSICVHCHKAAGGLGSSCGCCHVSEQPSQVQHNTGQPNACSICGTAQHSTAQHSTA